MRRLAPAIGIVGLLAAAGAFTGAALWGQATAPQTPGETLAALVERLAPISSDEGLEAFLHEQDRRDTETEQKRSVLDEECRSLLRKANRDQQWPSTLRCVRNDMQLDIGALRAELTAARALKHSLAPALVTAASDLLDALAAVTDGIDTGVYGSEGALAETRSKLQERYRTPLTKATQAMHWAVLRSNLWETARTVHAQTGALLTQEQHDCLSASTEATLQGAGLTDIPRARAAYREAAETVRNCIAWLRGSSDTATGTLLP